jgi:hypothetical protein
MDPVLFDSTKARTGGDRCVPPEIFYRDIAALPLLVAALVRAQSHCRAWTGSSTHLAPHRGRK